jgi:hypothetical protein
VVAPQKQGSRVTPELENMGDSEQAREALENALVDAWEAIDTKIIEACMKSMYRRRDAVFGQIIASVCLLLKLGRYDWWLVFN